MPKWRIELQKDICIGCGACAIVEPKHWSMYGDKSKLKDATEEQGENGAMEVKIVESIDRNQDAADACPVPCIFVKKIED